MHISCKRTQTGWNAYFKTAAKSRSEGLEMLSKLKEIEHKCSDAITKQLRKVSILKRLNLSFLVLLISVATFLTFFSFCKYSQEVIFHLEQSAAVSVQNIHLKVQEILEKYEALSVRFYEDEDVLNAVAENEFQTLDQTKMQSNRRMIEKKLYNVVLGSKYVKSIQLVTPKYQYHMVEKNGYRRGGTIKDLEWFYQSEFYQSALEHHGYPVWIEDAGQNYVFYESEQSVYGLADIITMAVAIYQPSTREFLGVLTMNVDIKAFQEAARGIEANQDGNLFLIGEDGVLTGFNPSISAPSFPTDSTIFKRMLKHKKDVVRTNVEGEKVLFAYENIPGTDMFSVYIADMKTLLSGLTRTRNLCIGVLIGVVIICCAISYFVTKSISDPVRKLVKVMGKAGDGKWTVRYENSGCDEITVLGDRFNEMADKTNQLIEEVYLSEIRRQKLQLSWKNAQLDAMLMQINPHFLYNTLDIIRWEAMYEANGESTVTRMIEQFSKLCRLGMKAGGYTVSMIESLEHAKAYVDVINFRHQEKIQFDIDVDEMAQTCYVPQFMLQPILENSVVHGFCDASKGCEIQMKAKVEDGRILRISVKDNGKGMSKEELQNLREYIQEKDTPEKSIGMVNVNQRIQLFYGEEYGLVVDSKENQGTVVEVILPVRLHTENMKKISEEAGNIVSGSDCR